MGPFTSEYEDYLAIILSIFPFHTNLVPIVSFSTGQQQGGVRAIALAGVERAREAPRGFVARFRGLAARLRARSTPTKPPAYYCCGLKLSRA